MSRNDHIQGLDDTTGKELPEAAIPGQSGMHIRVTEGHLQPSSQQIRAWIYEGSVRLADGSPVYHALLHPDEAGVVDTCDSQDAIRRVHALTNANPYVVWACRDKSGDQARVILEEALSGPALD